MKKIGELHAKVYATNPRARKMKAFDRLPFKPCDMYRQRITLQTDNKGTCIEKEITAYSVFGF